MTERRADRIVERGGKFVVVAKDSDREFGTYDTRAEAEERLAQIERFAEDAEHMRDDAEDDRLTSLRGSEFRQFDRAFAEDLRENHPDIWRRGGNVRGNEAFTLWGRARDGERTEGVVDWINEREAWAARHFQNNRLPGVVAQIKWGVVGTLGEARMKALVNEAKERSRGDRAPAVHTEPKTWLEERRTTTASVRFDRATPAGSGWMRFDALFSRGDIVKPYRLDGRIVREFLPVEEALDPESMDSGIGAPLTLGHPPANLRSDTVLGQGRGAVLDVHAHEDGVHTAGGLVVWDAEALDFIASREAAAERGDGIGPELSVGFTLKIDPRGGVHDGVRYDRVQRQVRWNHAALEERGNAKTARVLTSRADAAGDVLDDLRPVLAANRLERTPFIDLGAWTRHDGGLLVPADTTTQRSTTMKTIKIDGGEHEVPGPVAAHIERQDAALTDKDARISELQAQLAERQDAAKDLIPASEVEARADARAREYAEAFELCRAAAGPDWRDMLPERRKDAEGSEITRELGDYLELGIRHAFGERADEVFGDIDAARDRGQALDLYARQAKRLLERRDSNVVEIKKTIARAASEGKKRDAAEDGLAKAYQRQDALARDYIGSKPNKEIA